MKILALHSDFIRFEAKKKAIEAAEELTKVKEEIKECLVVFTSVEKQDEPDPETITDKYVNAIIDILGQINEKRVVLYPYVHLSPTPSNAKTAMTVLLGAEKKLSEKGYEVHRSPFGWYKAFTVSCKGHPLSELSRELRLGQEEEKKAAKHKDAAITLDNRSLSAQDKMNLTGAVLIAAAIKALHPEAGMGVLGIHNDQAFVDIAEVKLGTSEFEAIEKKTLQLAAKNEQFKNDGVPQDAHQIEIAKELGENAVAYSAYGLTLVPLFKDPFIDAVKKIQSIKIIHTGSAYWRNNAKNDQLTRIYCVAFDSPKKLQEYMQKLADAQARDHTKLGRELDLYVTSDAIGKGLPLLTPKGTTIKRILQRWIEDEEIKRGYSFTDTPVLTKTELYKISGHLAHYRESMFIFKTDEEELALRPMTCPHQFMIYKAKTRSYRDLPIRYAEFANLFRNESSGELHGMTRIRQFCLADAHIICMPEQIEHEFEGVIDLIQYIMSMLGIKDYWYRFSKWDPNDKEKYVDNPPAWEETQAIMKKIIDKMNLTYEEKDGEAAFYGPKLDIQLRNVYGKEDTFFTVQIDFSSPEKFDMCYEGQDGKKHRPMIIHRSSIGCFERTMAHLIEMYNGKFPLWLNPVQVKVVNVADRNIPFAQGIVAKLKEKGIRVEFDDSQSTISRKVRDAQLEKVNYIITIGDKEEQNNTLAVRSRAGDVRFGIDIEAFISEILEEIAAKTIK